MAPADPGSELPKITVDLEPIGRRVRVSSGTSLLDAARLAGYAGALAWSALANDEASDGRAVESALRPSAVAASPGADASAGCRTP